VTTASSFVETRDGRALICNTLGYERPLEDHGLPAVRPALRRLNLTGPAVVSLALLRLEGVEAGIRHPAKGIIDREPVSVTSATEFLDVDSIDALLLRGALREPFDRLRQKLGLEPASIEGGRS
jgi:hypothetical protein